MLIDTHTHLDHTDRDPGELMAEAAAADVGLVIQSGTDLDSSRYALELAQQHPRLFASVGFHPHDAGRLDEEGRMGLQALAEHPRVVALGETGFDFYHDRWPHDIQEEAFVAQLELARAADLPVVIHTREAAARTLAVLEEHAEGLTVILHCFSLVDHLAVVLERGYYLSFAGNVTYKNAVDLQEACRHTPLDRLLLETDAPYLTPVPLRGRPNRPALVAHTYAFVAALHGLTVAELAPRVAANVGDAFPRVREVLAEAVS